MFLNAVLESFCSKMAGYIVYFDSDAVIWKLNLLARLLTSYNVCGFALLTAVKKSILLATHSKLPLCIMKISFVASALQESNSATPQSHIMRELIVQEKHGSWETYFSTMKA